METNQMLGRPYFHETKAHLLSKKLEPGIDTTYCLREK